VVQLFDALLLHDNYLPAPTARTWTNSRILLISFSPNFWTSIGIILLRLTIIITATETLGSFSVSALNLELSVGSGSVQPPAMTDDESLYLSSAVVGLTHCNAPMHQSFVGSCSNEKWFEIEQNACELFDNAVAPTQCNLMITQT